MKRIYAMTFALVGLSGSASALDFSLGAIEGGGGLVSVSNDIGRGFLLSGRLAIGEIADRLELDPEVTFWSASQQFGALAVTNRDFILGANLRYWLQPLSDWRPYVGGGLGWNSFSTKGKHPRFGEATIGKNQLGGHVFGGARYRVSDSLGTFAEVRYSVSSERNLWVWGGLSYSLN